MLEKKLQVQVNELNNRAQLLDQKDRDLFAMQGELLHAQRFELEARRLADTKPKVETLTVFFLDLTSFSAIEGNQKIADVVGLTGHNRTNPRNRWISNLPAKPANACESEEGVAGC